MRLISLFVPSLVGGGAERVMVELAKGFHDAGFHVDIVLSKAEGPYLSEVPPAIRVVDLGKKKMLSSIPGLVKYLRSERPMALLSTITHANVAALWARGLARVPTRVVVREAEPVSIAARSATSTPGSFMPFFVRQSYRSADAIVAVSKGVADDLAQVVNISRNQINVIYSPIITPDLAEKAAEPLDEPWFLPGSPPVILGAGRLAPEKDFPTLIAAFALVRKTHRARLMIIGEGELRAKLQAQVQQMGLQDDVLLPGFKVNPFGYMARSKVFVLSSLREGLPGALIQAMSCGCSIVSTDCPSGGAVEALDGGRLGQIVQVGDAEGMAAAIQRALDEPQPMLDPEWLSQFTPVSAIDKYLACLTGQLETNA